MDDKYSMKKIIILGAGLAGSVAYNALSSMAPVVYEAKSEDRSGLNEHHAVMRFRNTDIGKYLGCEMVPVCATKSVFRDGQLFDVATIADNNEYSLKCYGSLADRSLHSLGRVERYIACVRPMSGQIVVYDAKVEEVFKIEGVCGMMFSSQGDVNLAASENRLRYDICISTLPLPVILRICGINHHMKFKSKPITVRTCYLDFESSVHQTVYFPSHEFHAYRATLQNSRLIVEFDGKLDSPIDSCVVDKETLEVMKIFGLGSIQSWGSDTKVQPMGKIVPVDDDSRRAAIMELTDMYNIYSLGRYATWRPLRADHLVNDIAKIQRMINVSEKKKKYYEKLSGSL